MKTKRCRDFCKQYDSQLTKQNKTWAKKYKDNPAFRPPTKKETQFSLKVCKKTHCNKTCKGFDFFGDIKKQKQFLNHFKNGFPKTFSNNKIASLKRKGALSSCLLAD
jgi:hypothetical protein